MTDALSFRETFKYQRRCLKEDYDLYLSKSEDDNVLGKILHILTSHGFHAMIVFRIGKILYSFHIPIISPILKAIYQILRFFFITFYGISLNPVSEIGPRFYVAHYGCIVVRGVFGKNCSITQGVTVGSKGAGKTAGWPVFGDNVYIAAGAKVIGDVKIGNNVRIGANAVVITDVPDNSVAVGVPAKIKPIL
ncbi:MAG: serine O-acetyltransferase [Cellvibrionaceae bacterium]